MIQSTVFAVDVLSICASVTSLREFFLFTAQTSYSVFYLKLT